MSVHDINFEIFALSAPKLVFKVLHQFVGLRLDVTPEPGEVGQVKFDVDQEQILVARHEGTKDRRSA